MRLTSVRIFVDDLEKAAAFYENVVGLNRTTTAPTAILFEEFRVSSLRPQTTMRGVRA